MSLYRRCITVAFTQWKILGWFPVFGDHKYSCHEYSGRDFCVNIFHFSSIITQECALLSCKVSEYLSLCKSLGMFSRITGPFAHQQYEWSNFSASLPEFGIVSIFNFSLYDRCEVVLLCGSALLTMPKPLTMWMTINCGKFLKRWEYQTTWPASWETSMQARKQQLELDMEQQTGSNRKRNMSRLYN